MEETKCPKCNCPSLTRVMIIRRYPPIPNHPEKEMREGVSMCFDAVECKMCWFRDMHDKNLYPNVSDFAGSYELNFFPKFEAKVTMDFKNPAQKKQLEEEAKKLVEKLEEHAQAEEEVI